MQKPGLFGMNGFMVFLFTFLSVAASAQQPEYMILIDAENKQAFTVRVGAELFASSSHGHIVLSHLKDSSYRLYVRFPKKNLSEQVFPVIVRKKDLGFQLMGTDSTWILYNWQTRETIRPVIDRDSSRILDRGIKSENGFSRLMAAVVNDSSVMYNTYTVTGFRDSSGDKSLKPQTAAGMAKTEKTENMVSSPAPGGQITNTGKETAAAISSATRDSVISQPHSAGGTGDVTAMADQRAGTRDSLSAVKKARKDSLQAAKKATKDSLLVIRNARKDSMALARKQAYSQDSLAKLARRATKDSLQTVKKQQDALKQNTAVAAVPTPTPILKPVSDSNVNRPSLQQSGVSHHPSAGLSTIKKLREVSLKVSRKIVFVDIGKTGSVDTITLFVYFETGVLAAKKAAPTGPSPVQTAKIPVKTDSVNGNTDQVKIKGAVKSGVCAQLATEGDLEALRSAILRANTEQEKIDAASSAFAMNCFTVVQLRMLANLLVSDKAKYRLMDAANGHIADREHFRELADMYTDKNFKRKFLVLADKRS